MTAVEELKRLSGKLFIEGEFRTSRQANACISSRQRNVNLLTKPCYANQGGNDKHGQAKPT